MKAVAVLPVKRFEDAKQRLASALSPARRRALAEAMLADVLEALASCDQLERVIVVSSEPRARALATASGAELLGDPEQPGHNAAARHGIAHATAHDERRALLIPGDCPALRPADVAELLGAAPAAGASVVAVSDRHGTGTNALLLSPAMVIDPSFGPDSLERHRQAAVRAGAAWVLRRPWPLLHDVDTPEDLEALRRALGAEPDVAARTRATLAPPAASRSPA